MLMALEPSVFMFDEPTAGMSVDEVPVILDLIRELKARRDKTILLVEHKMDVVRELADRIIVLHNGQLVADGEPAAVIASPIVQQAYLGLRRAARRRPACSERRAAAATCSPGVHTHIGAYHILHGVDFDGAARAGHDAARPQRRRQDDDAAHDHGPVGGVAGPVVFDGSDRRPAARIDARACAHAARSPQLRHRLRAREHGHLRRPHASRENMLLAARARAHASTQLDSDAPRVAVRPVPGAEEVLAPSRPASSRAGRSRCSRSRARSSSRAGCC